MPLTDCRLANQYTTIDCDYEAVIWQSNCQEMVTIAWKAELINITVTQCSGYWSLPGYPGIYWAPR